MEEIEKEKNELGGGLKIISLKTKVNQSIATIAEESTELAKQPENQSIATIAEESTELAKQPENQQIATIAEESIDIHEQPENNLIIENNTEEQKLEDTPISRKFVTIKKEADLPIWYNTTGLNEWEEDNTISESPVSELFVNYVSDFHKNEKTIMQKIRHFKMLPKTSIWFLFTIIIITVSIIAVLMKVDPNIHSLDNYKANFFLLIWKEVSIDLTNNWAWNVPAQTWVTTTLITDNTQTWVTSTWIIEGTQTWAISTWIILDTQTWAISTWTTENTQKLVTSTWVIEEEKFLIKEKWLKINPATFIRQDGSREYFYKWKSFSKEQLQDELRNEVKIEIDKKTKEYLNKLYIK